MGDRIIHIFFAFTEDAISLLNIANHEIELINNWFSTKIPINLKLHDWKHTGVSNMGNPEKNVLSQMPIEDSNIFIAVFRFNYGKPTGNTDPLTGNQYKSGMEEEFYTAYRYWQKHNTPDIIIMKSEEDVPRKNIRTQSDFADIDAFFDEFRAEGAHPGLFSTFNNEVEFGEIFRRNIMSRVVAILQGTESENAPEIGSYYKQLGLLDLFLDDQNNVRNSYKTKQIKSTKRLRLHARTCYSFISRLGSFYAEIHSALENGMTFHVIMQNPWSLNAIYAARSEDQFKKQFAAYQKNQITAEELLKAFEASHWYKERYLSCVEGYKVLKKEFGKQIQLRFSDMDLSNSILLSDNELFFEPYLNSISVGHKNIPLYEIRATKKAVLYIDAERDFEDMWKSGCGYDKFQKTKADYRTRIREYLDCEVRG